MNDNFAFLNQQLFWPVIVGAVLILLVFIWKEWSNSQKNRLFFKIIVALIAIGSLALIALKPAFLTIQEKGIGVLITQGHDETALDSLRNIHNNLVEINYSNSGLAQKKLDSISSLFIIGHGLQSFDFWQLKGISTTYIGGTDPIGVTRLHYNQEANLGSELQLECLYNKPQKRNRLVLQNPAGFGVDSTLMNTELKSKIRLTSGLKAEGKFVYYLVEKDSADNVLSSGPLPINVTDQKPLNILFINSFPTFETKYLKNYLAEKRHKILVRSQLTKAKYKFEYFNRERAPFYRFSKENLKEFDLLIIDSDSFKNLSSKSKLALINSVKENGLGVFIQPNSSFFESSAIKPYFKFRRTSRTEINFDEWPKIQLSKYPVKFTEEPLLEVVNTSKNEILSAYRRLGKGRVGTSILENTHQLILNGNAFEYQVLWTNIIGSISNRNELNSNWETSKMTIIQDQPFDFKLRTIIEKPEVINGSHSRIPIRQDIDIPNLWSGKNYPRETGWDQLIIQGDTTSILNFYVLDSTKWRSLRSYNRIQENQRQFGGQTSNIEKVKSFEEISPLWFFAIFVVSMGWLWVEPRLYGN